MITLGVAVAAERLLGDDPRYPRVVDECFDSVTPENAMKMDVIHPEPSRYEFAEADRIVEWSRARGKRVRGHPLIWHRQLPRWVESGRAPRDLERVLYEHVTGLVAHFRGRVDQWDVVNEPLTRSGRLRRTLWERHLGPGYIELAFHAARAADPSAELMLNEFGVETENAKLLALLRLSEALLERGVPLHGIGIQAHLRLRRARGLRDVLARVSSLGLMAEVTELDVALPEAERPRDDAWARQSAVYASVGEACSEAGTCPRITVWGVNDGSSWLGARAAPLPFFDDYTPKPAYLSLARAAARDGRSGDAERLMGSTLGACPTARPGRGPATYGSLRSSAGARPSGQAAG